MLREEDGEKQRPAFDARRRAVDGRAAASKEIDDSGSGEGAGPGEEGEAIEPGTDGVGAPRDRTLLLVTDLKGIRTQLYPVVDDIGYWG